MHRRTFLATTMTAALGLTSRAWAQDSAATVAIIGHSGRGDYGHGLHTMWLALPETRLVGVADADPKGLDGARKKLNGLAGFADYRTMLRETKPDIVVVAPRHIDQHAEMTLAAIEAGARGIYIEKPFCRTPAEADAIVAAAAKTGTRVAIAHRNRWHPALPVVKQAMSDGTLGTIVEIRARGKEDARGGALDLWVLGSHLVNLIHYLGGAPVACSASMFKGKIPVGPADIVAGAEGVGPIAGDRLHARFEMEDGVVAYFDSIRQAGVAAANFGVQIVGTKGLIDLRIDVQPFAHFVPGNPFQPGPEPRPWIPISSAGIGKPEPVEDLKTQVANHQLPARDLLAAMRDKRPTLCSEIDGRVTVEMIHAVFASHVKNSARITWPLASREHALAGWA